MNYRDRIVGFERIDPSKLIPRPENWPSHGTGQREVMKGVLEDIGVADTIVVRRYGDAYQILDGHLRREELTQPIPAVIVDLDDDEARHFLVFHDTLTSLATTDDAALAALLHQCDGAQTAQSESLVALLGKLRSDSVGRVPDPPSSFPIVDETVRVAYTCPKCGFAWSGKP